MIIIGLTGGIGMGKSTVAGMLRRMGVPVFDADRYVHRCLNRRGPGVLPVARAFPQAYDRKNEKINRLVLAQIVTNAAVDRKKLESLLHPLVRRAELRFIARHRKKGAKQIVLDIPLLFETGADALCDQVICVSAPLAIRRARVLARPGMNEERFRAIVKAQMKESRRHAKSDFILDTGGTHARTESDLQKLLKRIEKDHARNRSRHRNHGV